MGLVIYYFNINAVCFLSGWYVSFSVSILLYIYFVIKKLMKSTLAVVIVMLILAAESLRWLPTVWYSL